MRAKLLQSCPTLCNPMDCSPLGSSVHEILHLPLNIWVSLTAQLIKNPPAMQETLIPFLGWEDPLEKGKATHSSILAWRIHGMYIPWDGKEWDTAE